MTSAPVCRITVGGGAAVPLQYGVFQMQRNEKPFDEEATYSIPLRGALLRRALLSLQTQLTRIKADPAADITPDEKKMLKEISDILYAHRIY